MDLPECMFKDVCSSAQTSRTREVQMRYLSWYSVCPEGLRAWFCSNQPKACAVMSNFLAGGTCAGLTGALGLQESFDFIHARNIAHSVKDWPIVLSEVIRSVSTRITQ